MRFETIMAPPDAGGRAKFPAGTPPSLYLPTTGWVAIAAVRAGWFCTLFAASSYPLWSFMHIATGFWRGK